MVVATARPYQKANCGIYVNSWFGWKLKCLRVTILSTQKMIRPCYHIICHSCSVEYWYKLCRQLFGYFLDHLMSFNSEFFSGLLYTDLLSWWSCSLFLLAQGSFFSPHWAFWRACMPCWCQLKSVTNKLIDSSTAWQKIWWGSNVLHLFYYIYLCNLNCT